MGRYTNETGLVQAIVKAVKERYPTAWILKVHGGQYQQAGVPDLMICIDGLLIGAEAKFPRPGESLAHTRERATAIQRQQIRLINDAGGMAGVVTTPDETLDLIERAFRKQETIRADRQHVSKERDR